MFSQEIDTEDQVTYATGFTKVKEFVTKMAGKPPTNFRIMGDDIVSKAIFPYLIRIMAYDKGKRVKGTRWFGSRRFKVGGAMMVKYFEIAERKVPKMNVGVSGVLDGCNYVCEKHVGE
jgi:hypothetical protein